MSLCAVRHRLLGVAASPGAFDSSYRGLAIISGVNEQRLN